MSDTVRHVKAVELAAEVGVSAKEYRRKLREAAARGHIKHFKNQRWAVRAWSDEHGILLSVLRRLVGYNGASRLRQLEQEFYEMRGRYPPELPPR